MAANTWAALNAQNANKTITPATPQVGYGHQALNAVGSGIKATAGMATNFFGNLTQHLASYGQDVGNDYGSMAKNLGGDFNTINQGAQDTIKAAGNNPLSFQNPGQQLAGMGKMGSGILQMGGDTLQGVFAPVTEALKPLVNSTVSGLNTIVDHITGKPVGTAAQSNQQDSTALQQKLAQYSQTNPESLKNLNAAVNIIMSLIGEKGAETTGNVEDLPGKISTGIKNTSEDLSMKFAPGATEETPAAISNDITSSRIKDATPVYDENMIGQNVMTPDTVDANGNVVKGKISPRIASEGAGFFKGRPVTTSASEHAAGTELGTLKDYPDEGTALEKGLAVQKSISTEAEGMRANLQIEDKTSPLDINQEKSKISDLVKSNLPKDIKEKIGFISSADEAKLSPAAKTYREALVSQQEETLPKTAAGRYYQKVLDAVNNYDGTREGKLNLRQAIDDAYKNARGKLAFGSDSQNALDETHSDIRDAINKDLKESTTNTDTQASLDRQSNLYRAKKVLDANAKAESDSAYGRIKQEHPMLGKTINILQRQGVMIPLRIAEAGLGLAALTTYLNSLRKK